MNGLRQNKLHQNYAKCFDNLDHRHLPESNERSHFYYSDSIHKS